MSGLLASHATRTFPNPTAVTPDEAACGRRYSPHFGVFRYEIAFRFRHRPYRDDTICMVHLPHMVRTHHDRR